MGEAVEHFSYDGVGNRLSDNVTTGSWAYNQNNELQGFDNTSFKYNLNGQMTEKTVNGVKTEFFYNWDGRLKEIKNSSNQTLATYRYDPFGRRTSKHLPQINETIYFHYSDEGLIAEYDETGQLIQSYGYKPNSFFTTDPVFTQRPDFISKAKGGYVYYINDHLYTPQKLITETGRKVWEAHAEAFGKTTITNNEFRNPLRFPGQYKDQEQNLSYNFWRYYDSDLGRYISSDPVGMFGGINTYAYVLSSPLNHMDYTGLDCVTVYKFVVPDFFSKKKISEIVIDKGKWRVSHSSAHLSISKGIMGMGKKGIGKNPANLVGTGRARCQLLKIIQVKVTYQQMGTEYSGGYCTSECDIWFWDEEKRVVADEWDEIETRKKQKDTDIAIQSASKQLANLACHSWLKKLK